MCLHRLWALPVLAAALVVLAAAPTAPAAGAAGPNLGPRMEFLKGSRLIVTYPSGRVTAFSVRGTWWGVGDRIQAGADWTMRIWSVSKGVEFRRTSRLCDGGTWYPVTRWGGLEPSGPTTATFAASGEVTVRWSPALGAGGLLGCNPVDPERPFTPPGTLVLTGRAGAGGLGRLVLQGRADGIPSQQGLGSYRLVLVTRVHF
jgi:hypothetical protein